MRADWIEPLVWDMVKAAILDPAIIINEIRKNLETDQGNLAPQIKKLQQDIEKLEGEQYRLLQQRQRDLVDQELLERLLAPIKPVYDEKRQILARLLDQQKLQQGSERMEQVIRECCGKIAEKLDGADFDAKRAVFAAFDVNIEATTKELLVQMTVDPDLMINGQSRRHWWPQLLESCPG